jgi:hypothetical protein
MEYSPWSKINMSRKERQALIDAPPMKARSLYTKEYAKKAKTASQNKDAMAQAYGAVEKAHGKEMSDKLKAYHDANYNDNDGMKNGGSASKKHCW